MSEKIKIFKNKGEVFKCQLQVEGASYKNTSVRLRLEFSDNNNLYFNGKVEEDGTCTINVPKLKNVEDKEGTLVIEAIADDTYFVLYDAAVELKNSVNVGIIDKGNLQPTIQKETKGETKIKLQNIKIETKEIKEEIPVESPKSESKFKPFRSFKEFREGERSNPKG